MNQIVLNNSVEAAQAAKGDWVSLCHRMQQVLSLLADQYDS